MEKKEEELKNSESMLEEKARLDEANFVAKNKKMTLEMEEIRAQLEEKKKALILKSKDMSAKESKLLEWQRIGKEAQ